MLMRYDVNKRMCIIATNQAKRVVTALNNFRTVPRVVSIIQSWIYQQQIKQIETSVTSCRRTKYSPIRLTWLQITTEHK